MIPAGLLLAAGFSSPGLGQSPPAYTADRLHCSRFHETAHSEVETESAGRVHRAVADRDGWWSFRARDSAGGVTLEGWYDSLAIRHGPADSLAAPDTDGLLGGRYRGLLQPDGRYERLAAPFVPDEVAEAADAAAALDDLLPLLPAAPLAPGRRWEDGSGTRIERLADSLTRGGRVERYVVQRRRASEESVPRGDTVPVPLRQTTTEEIRFAWHPAGGLLRRERESVTEASVPAGGRIRAPVRSRVVERARLERVTPPPTCR